MALFRIPLLGLFVALSLAAGQELITSKVHSAVFSPEQLFWPDLPKPASKAARKAEPKAVKQGPLHLAVLPIRIRAEDWKESIPCDSCHRLSANGIEFFLENYLAEKLRQRFPQQTVELVAPHSPFLETAKLNLLDFQDSLGLPWDKWFDGYGQELIYRPREWQASQAARKKLDRLGGLLGASHLLLPAKVWMKIEPLARDVHSGSMEWGFHLVFWNVATGRAEWAMAISQKALHTDLDKALDGRLDKVLVETWERMPESLAAFWKAEPY